jgi:hypothetical protein
MAVGTVRGGVVSDADFNIRSNAQRPKEAARPPAATAAAADVIQRIAVLHLGLFAADLEDMFDANFYGTVPTVFMRRGVEGGLRVWRSALTQEQYDAAGRRQRVWSFMRIAEVLQGAHSDLVSMLSPQHVELLRTCSSWLRARGSATRRDGDDTESARRTRYVRQLSRLLTSRPGNLDMFSETKFTEHDSYRSVGAVLHIVHAARGMIPDLYRDSALDNFGFLLRDLLEPCDSDMGTRIMRVAKYGSRVADAMLRIPVPQTQALEHFRDVFAAINDRRKLGQPTAPADLVALGLYGKKDGRPSGLPGTALHVLHRVARRMYALLCMAAIDRVE